MGTKARPAQLRTHPAVRQFQAERARKAARARSDPGRSRDYRWPADRAAILAEILTVSGPRRGRSAEKVIV